MDDIGQEEDNGDEKDVGDIVIDGKSAFEEAKERAGASQNQTATDTNPQAVDPAPAAEPAQPAAPASAVQTPETPQAPTDSADQQ